MFFLVEGGVGMIDTRGYLYKTFNDGTYFGHAEILERTTRSSTAKVQENNTSLYTIKRKDFLDLIELYPDVKADMLHSAIKRKVAKEKLVAQAIKFNFRLNKNQYKYIYIYIYRRDKIFDKRTSNLFNTTYHTISSPDFKNIMMTEHMDEKNIPPKLKRISRASLITPDFGKNELLKLPKTRFSSAIETMKTPYLLPTVEPQNASQYRNFNRKLIPINPEVVNQINIKPMKMNSKFAALNHR